MNRSLMKRRILWPHISNNRAAIFLKFRILNSLMPLIMCTKFQTNQIILTLFSGVLDKNPTPIAEKVVKCLTQDKAITQVKTRRLQEGCLINLKLALFFTCGRQCLWCMRTWFKALSTQVEHHCNHYWNAPFDSNYQAPFQIPNVYCNQNRIIKTTRQMILAFVHFIFVGKCGRPNFLTGDNSSW